MKDTAARDRPRLDGTVAVLTGVGRAGQVGDALARAFAEQGAAVVLLGREEQELQARAAELATLGFDASAHACDLTDLPALDRVRAAVEDRHGDGVNVLVNVAGGFAPSGPVADSDPTLWQRQIAINLTTAYHATRAFLPLLRRRNGSVLFFASVAALPGGRAAGIAAYTTAKSGVIALMRAVAEEERERGVSANALAPTALRTATNVSEMGEGAPLVELDTVADTVLFLCSPAGRALTGQVIRLG